LGNLYQGDIRESPRQGEQKLSRRNIEIKPIFAAKQGKKPGLEGLTSFKNG